MRLTAKERILVHLADFAKYAKAAEVPPEMGQDGIAKAAGTYLQHVRQFIDPLLKDGLARERVAHVVGHRRRLKVYDLTESGRHIAAGLREQVRGDRVRVRDADGVRETTVGELLRETKGTLAFGTIVRAAIDGETVDLLQPESEGASKSGFIERLGDLPHMEAFVGRRTELDMLTALGTGPRFFVVRGVAGIGKSSLAAKVCERLHGTRSLFWHRIRPWDTRETILADLGEFLAQLGRPGLRAALARGEGDAADMIVREDLGRTASFLIFDDAQDGSSQVHAFLRFLKDTLATVADVRAMVLTRVALPAYDRRDVALSGIVQEIDLEGLNTEDIGEMLGAEPDAPKLMPLAERLDGHPLFLELLRSAGRADVRGGALRNVRRFIEEEIYSRLPERERTMMKLVSLYEVPVPGEALFLDELLSHDVLLALLDRSLVQSVGEEAFAAHDTIRDFFVSVSTPVERRRLTAFAVGQLRRLAAQDEELGNLIGSVHCLSNALRLSPAEPEQAIVAEALGDAAERIGDLPGSLTAYKLALKFIREAEGRARLHRKVAMTLQTHGEGTAAVAEVDAGFRALDGRPSVEQAWLDLVRCRVATRLEEFTEALEHGNRSVEVFRAFGDNDGLAEALLELGHVEVSRDGGSPDQAQSYLEDALARVPAKGGEAFAARVHMEMARNLAWRLLDVAGGMRHLAVAESLVKRVPDPHLERAFLMLRGRLNLDLVADFGVARHDFLEAIEVARHVHSRETIAFARFRLAHVDLLEGHAQEARQESEELAREMDALGYPNYAVDCWWRVAECSMWLGEAPAFHDALTRLKSAGLKRSMESRPLHAAVLRGLERWLESDRDGAIAAFRESVQGAEKYYTFDTTSPVYFTELYLAAALRAQGRESESDDHLRRCLEFLRKHSLKALLSVAPEACRRFAAFLRDVPPSAR